jgi:MFS family permease
MTSPPSTVRYTRLLILINALFWIAFSAITALGAHPSYEEANALRWAMAITAFLVAGILGALAGRLQRRSRQVYWLAVASLTAVAVAAVFDDLGPADVLFIVITLLPLALLLKDREWHQGIAMGPGQENRAA